MRILVDSELLDSQTNSLSPEMIFPGLLTHEHIFLLRYEEVPVHTAVDKEAFWPSQVAEGWVTVGPQIEGIDGRAVCYVDGNLQCATGTLGNLHLVARTDGTTNVYNDLDETEAANRREADALAVQVAQAVHADVYVTDRPYLFATSRMSGRGVTILSPRDALTMVSLYLRTQGEYLTYRESGYRHGMGKGMYYWVGARELTPEAWRWFSACVFDSDASGDDTLLYLGSSVLQRVQRALEARDDVHRALNRPQNNSTADETLASLDIVFILLMGAVDAVARVAHLTLGLSSGIFQAAWQKQQWLTSVTQACPPLAQVVAPDSPGYHTLTILRLLRNSVHGEALQALAVQTSSQISTALGLPKSDMTTLLAAMDALGGQAAWSAQQLIPGSVHVDPGVLLEQLFPRVLELLNELMKNTPVEQLSHLTASTTLSSIPDDPHGPFAERNRLSIRWQLGL